MDKLGATGRHLELVKGSKNSSQSAQASSSTNSNTSKAAAKTARVVVSSPATVVNLKPSPGAEKAGSTQGSNPVRNYDDAKGLAKSIAERLSGDEHEGLTAEHVTSIFKDN